MSDNYITVWGVWRDHEEYSEALMAFSEEEKAVEYARSLDPPAIVKRHTIQRKTDARVQGI